MLRIFKFLMPLLYMSMAKVTGPLFSLTASGKLADVMVHFPWKGRQVVRQWLKPSNPRTAKQGQARLYVGGLGRACSKVISADAYAGYARAVADTGQTWVSALVKYMIDVVFTDAAAFDAFALEAINHTAHAGWVSEAQDLELVKFEVTPKLGERDFEIDAILYALAKYGTKMNDVDPEKFNVAPYTKDLDTWELADIQIMVGHMNVLLAP